MKEKVKAYIADSWRRYKKLPGPVAIAAALDTTKEHVTEIFQELIKEDFMYAYSKNESGVPISSYHIPRNVLLQFEQQPQAVKRPAPKQQTTISLIKVVIFAICIIMALISLGAMCVSIYFSYQFTSTFLPGVIAVILSGGITLYIAFAPEGAFLLYETSTPDAKGKKHVPGIGKALLFTAVLALLFSMSMTIIGQFNANSEKLKTKSDTSKSQNTNFEKLLVLQKAEKDIQKSREITLENILEAQSQAKKYAVGSRERGAVMANLNKWMKDIEGYDAALNANRDKQALLYDAGAEKQDERFSFYTWFAHTFGPPSGVVEFILYLIPALFCDIISPLGISLVVFLATRFFKREEKEV